MVRRPLVETLFEGFLASSDTLRIYHGEKLVFVSKEKGLAPLVNYIAAVEHKEKTFVLDKVVGNAAALLSKLALCEELWSPLGSALAAKTLQNLGTRYHFVATVPHIVNREGTGMCPFEKLSLGKNAEEFYTAVSTLLIA